MIEQIRNQKEVQMIIFRLGNEEYCVPITCVQEIIMSQETTKIPRAPKFVEGVINLRGHIIPIIDGLKKFELNDETQTKNNQARIMVLDLNSKTIGLVVSDVSEVIHLKTEDIEATPVDTGDEDEFIWGIGKFNNRLLILIDPLKILTSADCKELNFNSENKSIAA